MTPPSAARAVPRTILAAPPFAPPVLAAPAVALPVLVPLALALVLSGCADPPEADDPYAPAPRDLGVRRDLAPTPPDLAARPAAPPDLAPAADLCVAEPPPLDLGPPDATAPPDATVPPADAPPPDAARPDAPAADLGGCHPLVSELQTGGTDGSDEMVELQNPCGAAVDVAGWALVYRAGTNVNGVGAADSSTLATLAGKLGPGERKVACGPSFVGPCDLPYGAGRMKDGAGAVGLRDGQRALVDSVAYGAVDPMHAFVQGAPAPAPAARQSIGRLPDGAASGHNDRDFRVTRQVTPGAPNR